MYKDIQIKLLFFVVTMKVDKLLKFMVSLVKIFSMFIYIYIYIYIFFFFFFFEKEKYIIYIIYLLIIHFIIMIYINKYTLNIIK